MRLAPIDSYLNTLSPVTETFREEFGGAALLVQGWALQQKLTPGPVSLSFCFLLVDQNVSSQLLPQRRACLSAAALPSMMVVVSPSEAISKPSVK